jgi:simple sugar transport system permease protein
MLRSPRLLRIAIPIAATIFAFAVGGLVVAATGRDPFLAYIAIFNGTGLNFLLPTLSAAERDVAAANLQQTLLIFVPLSLAAIAVALPFQAGLFNIGGQGQYVVGLVAALAVGTVPLPVPEPLHLLLAVLAAAVAGALWASIAGILRARTGAHEVLSTIMLNVIAVFGARSLFELGGLMQGPNPFAARSADVLDSARLPAIWGTLQPLHGGIFIALLGLLVFHLLVTRTTLGFEIRTIGHNPTAGRFAGISIERSFIVVMLLGGAFAGLAGAMDILGWKFRVAMNDVDGTAGIAFVGIAAAMLGRNSAVGIGFAALLFAALQVGTSARQLDPSIIPPELAGNLSIIIQALVVLLAGTHVLVTMMWPAFRRLGRVHQRP